MAKILLGMSGGVDSTVAARLLLRDGHEVTGITFIMHESQHTLADDARRAADELGIRHETVDMRSAFREKVILPFAEAYASGQTPNPCVLCNKHIKFPKMLEFADAHGFDLIATGHYASLRKKANGEYRISAATDAAKDQTYFLYTLTEDILSRLVLPLAGLTKAQVREIAKTEGFTCAAEKESQDVCFIEKGGLATFLRQTLERDVPCGDFVDCDGNVLGRHTGIIDYTVGQRKGLGIAFTEPLYVKDIDASANRVVLCTGERLFEKEIFVNRCVFPSKTPPTESFRADVRIRYTKMSAPALLAPYGDGFRIVFDTPQRAPARGQSAVFFDGDELIGGGIIK